MLLEGEVDAQCCDDDGVFPYFGIVDIIAEVTIVVGLVIQVAGFVIEGWRGNGE